MPKFAANLSMMYPEVAFLDRFEAAAKDGFKAVEFLFPYAWDKAEIAARLKGNGLQQVLFKHIFSTIRWQFQKKYKRFVRIRDLCARVRVTEQIRSCSAIQENNAQR